MFYVNPPKGQVALHILENIVFTRLEYLKLLQNNNTDSFCGNFEYLLENSVYDNIGHFTLRLIAAASFELWPFWVRNEGLLFKQRLSCLSVRQIHRLLRNILKHLTRRQCNDTPASKALIKMSDHFLKPEMFNHIVDKEHTEDCRKYHCQVPFTAVPDLIGQRKIDLHLGMAMVVCSEWKVVLLSLFQTFLLEEKNRILRAERTVTSDPRLSSISKRLHGRILDDYPDSGSITTKNINMESKKFPLCMQNLHSILRTQHRLSHHARFQYSLFLKECGMKLNDSIDYWREEYSKPHVCQSGCTHDWQTNERKFVYSIRHLYGLEGGRKNYKTPNCRAICSDMPGLRYEGGCPFKHFDANKLGILLQTCMTDLDIEDFTSMRDQSPEMACSAFLTTVHKCKNEHVVIHSPVQFYKKVKEMERIN